MGLITEEVEVTLHPTTIKYYENLGYKIFRRMDNQNKYKIPRGTKIIVRVEDLTDGSNAKVNIKCDHCGKELKNIKWQNYKRYVKEDGKYYCQKCAMSYKCISFEQWCIENNRQDVLDRWDYELNNCHPSEISYITTKKYYLKCSRKLHKSKLKNINAFINGQEGSIKCNQCNSFAQWGIDHLGDNFLEKYWDYDKNTVDPWIISYGSKSKKVWIKCQEKDYHISYSILPNSFTSQNQRCPYCRGFKIHPLDSLGELLKNRNLLHLWSDRNIKSPYDYMPYSGEYVWWKCPKGKHDDFYRIISKLNIHDFRCPECNCSKGEEKISNYLINKCFIKITQNEYKTLNKKNLNRYYIPQKEFDDLIGLGGGLLSYDFYLPSNNLLIEYDGEFHYIPIKLNKNEPIKYAKKRLKKQQAHDRLKDDYAKNHNINILRIPYWDFDNIELILQKELNLVEEAVV